MILARDMVPVRMNARQWPRVHHPASWIPLCVHQGAGQRRCFRQAQEMILMPNGFAPLCYMHARTVCRLYGGLANPLKHVNGDIGRGWPYGNRNTAREHLRWLRASGRPIR